MLTPDKLYRLPGGVVVKCLEIGPSCAIVRPVGKHLVQYTTDDGELVSFESHYNAFTISVNSVIPEVSEDGEEVSGDSSQG